MSAKPTKRLRLHTAGRRNCPQQTWRVVIATRLATFIAILTPNGIKRLSYRSPSSAARRRRQPRAGRLPLAVRKWVERLAAWLHSYAAGCQMPCCVPLDLREHSAFQRRVWHCLRRVPFGATVTYGEIALRLGCRSPRAVGMACGANPLPVVIPCHRVVGHNDLGGWSGLAGWKERLLQHEARYYSKKGDRRSRQGAKTNRTAKTPPSRDLTIFRVV